MMILIDIRHKKLRCCREARDASCMSVVNINSTIAQAQSSIISYFSFRFTDAYN